MYTPTKYPCIKNSVQHSLPLQLLLLASLICFSAVALADESEEAAQQGVEAEGESDQGGARGFDPCLVNPVLAVCKNNDTN